MGKKKTETKNNVQFMTAPETKDYSALRGLIQGANFTMPVVNSYGQAQKQLGDEYYEDTLPDEAVNRIKTGKMFNLNMQKGAALADATAREHEYKTQATASLAAGTAPQLVTAGSTSTQSGGFLGDLALATAS